MTKQELLDKLDELRTAAGKLPDGVDILLTEVGAGVARDVCSGQGYGAEIVLSFGFGDDIKEAADHVGENLRSRRWHDGGKELFFVLNGVKVSQLARKGD